MVLCVLNFVCEMPKTMKMSAARDELWISGLESSGVSSIPGP